MRSHERRSDRIHRKNVTGAAWLILVAAVVVVGLWLGTIGTVLRADNCEKDGPGGITVIAIDSTDVLNEIQRLALRNDLTDVVERLRVNDGVQIWRVAPSEEAVPEAAGPLICKPDRSVNPWIQNRRAVEKRYTEQFEGPVLRQLAKFIEGHAEPKSPIMESIQAIAIRTFDLPEYQNVNAKRLVLASDLIQNTSNYSQLRGVENFDTFGATQSYKKVAASLTGVSVEILYLQRSNSPSFKQHIEFWQQYFRHAGASLDRLRPVAGVS